MLLLKDALASFDTASAPRYTSNKEWHSAGEVMRPFCRGGKGARRAGGRGVGAAKCR